MPTLHQLCRFDLALQSRFKAISELRDGWDRGEARPVSGEIISAARKLISDLPSGLKRGVPVPAIVPMSRGAKLASNLQFEWDDGARSLELEIESPADIHYLKWDSDEGCEEDIFTITDVERVVSLIRWGTRS